MITSSDSFSTIDLGDYYAILPSDGKLHLNYKDVKKYFKPVKEGFKYNSGENPNFLTVDNIRTLIRKHIDSSFQPL